MPSRTGASRTSTASARRALLQGSSPLVDVGVGGSGYTVIEAARAGQPAIGCDLSLQGLLAARKFAQGEGVGERTLWICCSAEQLPLASGAFGAALAIAVLEHVPDDAAALRELARVLEAGGRAWVTVPHDLRNIPLAFRRANRRHDRRLGHLRRYEAEPLVDAARNAGLEPVEVQFTGHAVKVLQLVTSRIGESPLVVVRAQGPVPREHPPGQHAAQRRLRARVDARPVLAGRGPPARPPRSSRPARRARVDLGER